MGTLARCSTSPHGATRHCGACFTMANQGWLAARLTAFSAANEIFLDPWTCVARLGVCAHGAAAEGPCFLKLFAMVAFAIHDMADGGCSQMPMPPLEMTAAKRLCCQTAYSVLIVKGRAHRPCAEGFAGLSVRLVTN